ncbi:tetratricopeptide repeat protein [Sesbania bispinosa]|nr:tetratricopeptide repeat protein [Sesbania bispinosa]
MGARWEKGEEGAAVAAFGRGRERRPEEAETAHLQWPRGGAAAFCSAVEEEAATGRRSGDGHGGAAAAHRRENGRGKWWGSNNGTGRKNSKAVTSPGGRGAVAYRGEITLFLFSFPSCIGTLY